MFASGQRNLQAMVAKEPSSLDDARTIAYAIYHFLEVKPGSDGIHVELWSGAGSGDVLTRVSTLGPGDTRPHHMLG